MQTRLGKIEKKTYKQKIHIGLNKSLTSFKSKLSKETINNITEEIAANINSHFFPNGRDENNIICKEEADFTKAINSLSTASILKVYSSLESSADQEILKTHLNELFYKQYDSNLLAIERKDSGETHFSSKPKSLNVADKNSDASTPPEVLGVMTGKNSATLYSDRLIRADSQVKQSFYTAIFLQATYDPTFKLNNDGKLEIDSGTLSLASMPATNKTLKDEIIAYLKEFHKSYPDIKIKFDSLPAQDRAQVQAALDGPATDALNFKSPAPAPASSGLNAAAPSQVTKPQASSQKQLIENKRGTSPFLAAYEARQEAIKRAEPIRQQYE